MRTLRVTIVDPHSDRRGATRRALSGIPGVAVAAEAADDDEALQIATVLRPELFVIECSAPALDAFSLIARLRTALPAPIALTSDAPTHAVRAFEVGAVDCLIRPYAVERLRLTVERAREWLARADTSERPRRISEILDEPTDSGRSQGSGRRPYTERLPLKSGNRFLLLETGQISWIEAASNYVRVHSRRGTFLQRVRLGDLQQRLDPRRFVRIHRSTIVNLDDVREIVPTSQGDFDVLLESGHKLRMSRTYRDSLLAG